MSLAQTAILGGLAGFTIFLGLPLGRMQALTTRARVALAMFSVGILAFVFVDVLDHALAILGSTVQAVRQDHGGTGRLIGLTLVLAAGFMAGSAGLAMLERRIRPDGRATPPIAGGSTSTVAVEEAATMAREAELARHRALALGVSIAVAIGLHNFAEGLAIGVAARSGAISLATVLIIGFALHNATEGFGIVGPLAGVRPSWRWIGIVGLIGGGPTFGGSLLGYAVTSSWLSVAFYALAAGAILYVIGEIWQGMRRYGHRELGLYLLGVGFMAGVVTDIVVTLGGG